MSVCLSPVGLDEDHPDYEDVSMANGTWLEMTTGVPGVERWNQHHDPITYTPEQLRAVADAAKGADAHYFVDDLKRLADLGGATLS